MSTNGQSGEHVQQSQSQVQMHADGQQVSAHVQMGARQPLQQQYPLHSHPQQTQIAMPMRPYMSYPPMPMATEQNLSPLDQALKTGKCCGSCCDMKCGMPWLYGCGLGWGLTMAILWIAGIVAFPRLLAFFHVNSLLSLIGFILLAVGMLTCGVFGCIGNNKKNAGMIIGAIIGNILAALGQLAAVIQTIVVLRRSRLPFAHVALDFWIYVWIGLYTSLFFCYCDWIYDQSKFYKILNKFKQTQMMPRAHSLQMQQKCPSLTLINF